MNHQGKPFVSRRSFLTGTASAAGVAAAHFGHVRPAASAPREVLRIGLIGCGGRGSEAAVEALQAEPHARLVAMGDAFEDRLQKSLVLLARSGPVAARVDVPKERCFVGFDAYRGVINSADVVILATPPHFRPAHLAAAVAAGRHIFAEKPVAVDAPGVKTVLGACEEAGRKGLTVVSGFCRRYDSRIRDAIRRIHNGEIGEVIAIHANDFRGPIWVKPRQKDWTDMEWQMRNWYYFSWLSGDFNVEQHVHLLDMSSWIMKGEYPVKAWGTGGRTWRTAPEYGNIYDHHAVTYEYTSGVRIFSHCRHYPAAHNDSSVLVLGTKGKAFLSDRKIYVYGSRRQWEAQSPKSTMYQAEHDELFASIRNTKPINDGAYMSKSTLMAIMGRAATYTGQLVTWEQALAFNERLGPETYDWRAPLPVTPVPVPGT